MGMTAHEVGRSAHPTTGRDTGRRPRAVVEVPFIVATVLVAAVALLGARAPFACVVGIVAMLPAAIVDLRDHRLPNRLVAASGCALIVAGAVESSIGDRLDGVTPLDAGVGSLAFVAPLLVLHLAAPTSLGFGDVKAGLVLGAALGLVDPVASLLALLVAASIAIVGASAARVSAVPFGPALVLGAAVAAVATGTGTA